MAMKLMIIVGSTRPGRQGKQVADWFYGVARHHPGFETELVDLAELNLPFLDEPNHPSLHQYTQEHTKAWSRRVAAADAFVLVTAEYNHGYPPPLKNALDYLSLEWQRKPVAFVSYGGVAAGSRAVEQLRSVVSELHMADIRHAVQIPFIKEALNENGQPKDTEHLGSTAQVVLDDLAWWSRALKSAREAA
jgi:NAD(P)H-dependent FMN reductase